MIKGGDSERTAGDCVIIPAGASYYRRIPENPRYANSYNFVHLDLDTGNGAVYLRRWNDDGNRWLETLLRSRMDNASSAYLNLKQKLLPSRLPPQ